MSKVAVVYWSSTGNTESMANSIVKSLEVLGAEPTLFECSTFSADMIDEYDAFAFGCPACGDEELDEGDFAPLWESVKGLLGDKRVALFGSYGWGGGAFMESWKSSSEGVNIVADCVCEAEPSDDTLSECEQMCKALI